MRGAGDSSSFRDWIAWTNLSTFRQTRFVYLAQCSLRQESQASEKSFLQRFTRQINLVKQMREEGFELSAHSVRSTCNSGFAFINGSSAPGGRPSLRSGAVDVWGTSMTIWCAKRDLNPRPPRCKRDALPLSYSRKWSRGVSRPDTGEEGNYVAFSLLQEKVLSLVRRQSHWVTASAPMSMPSTERLMLSSLFPVMMELEIEFPTQLASFTRMP